MRRLRLNSRHAFNPICAESSDHRRLAFSESWLAPAAAAVSPVDVDERPSVDARSGYRLGG